MKIYHSTCAGNRNFGDILGPYIINKLTKHDVEYAGVGRWYSKAKNSKEAMRRLAMNNRKRTNIKPN